MSIKTLKRLLTSVALIYVVVILICMTSCSRYRVSESDRKYECELNFK